MRRTYQFLLLLYPRGHRDQFADEMLSVFEEARNERHYQGWGWYIRFALGEMTGLIGGAAGAWLDERREAPVPAQQPARGWQPQELIDAQQRVDANVAAMIQAIANHQFERARTLANQEREARENLRVLREKYGDEYGMSV
jgi:hypothetical protein